MRPRGCWRQYSYMLMAPLTWALRERISPCCGISKAASNSWPHE